MEENGGIQIRMNNRVEGLYRTLSCIKVYRLWITGWLEGVGGGYKGGANGS